MKIRSKAFWRMIFLSIFSGGAGMALDLGVFYVLFEYFHMDQYIANAIAITAGTILSFAINIVIIFKIKDKILRRFVLFYVTGIFGIFVSSFILWVGGLLHLPVLPVKNFSIFFVALAQFVINYFLAFDGGKRQEGK